MIQTSKYSVNPKITLVGAGPGDPELISLKAIKVIKTADVLLYDAVVSEDLFEYAPPHSIKIYIGTPADNQTYSQESLNKLMVDYALNYGHVVRLKSGDPFVFGKGFEELEYAASYSIPTEFVPGVSSVISVPGLLGIPVTHNNVSEGFLTIKGTDDADNMSQEMYSAAKYTGTVIVLMGIKRIEEIAGVFIKEGKGRLPVAVISNGSMKEEKMVIGVANTIAEAVADAKIQSPVLIIFGEVVALHPLFQSIRKSYEFVDGTYN